MSQVRGAGRGRGEPVDGDDDGVDGDSAAAGAVPGSDGAVARLQAVSEELADLALDRLHRAVSDGDPDSAATKALAAEERRITRARRAVERAVAILGSGTG